MEVFRSGEYPEVGSTQPKVQSSIVGSIAAKRLIRSSRVACMKRFQHLNLNSFIWYRLPHISTVTLLTSNVFDPSWPGITISSPFLYYRTRLALFHNRNHILAPVEWIQAAIYRAE